MYIVQEAEDAPPPAASAPALSRPSFEPDRVLRFEFDASTPAEDLADIGFQMVKDALGDRSAGVQYVEYNKASRVIYTLS